MNPVSSLMRRVRNKTPRQLLQRVVARIGERVDVAELEFPLFDEDVWDSSRFLRPASTQAVPTHLRVGWVIVPPGVGSGGHTTLFRMIKASQDAGMVNTVLLYDRYGGDFRVNRERIREGWPWLDCEVRPFTPRVEDFDVLVASSWQTAHVLAARSAESAVRRVYFVQDYEPWFYPRGTQYALAEDSYRFGFELVALGPLLAEVLAAEVGATSTVVPFGSDRVNYRLEDVAQRRGVVFFAKKANDRRGYRMAVLALGLFHAAHPDVAIHIYGDHVADASIGAINHGYLSPEQLNDLYNSVAVGLILSFTNVSLIPSEMAASGVIPVMNDYPGARMVFTNPGAVWSGATPTQLANALASAVEAASADRSRALSEWTSPTWTDTQSAVVDVLRYGGGSSCRDAAETSSV